MAGRFQPIYDVLAGVPPGYVVTYGQIARHLGMPYGGRTVGWAMRQCPDGLPWHRVVGAKGVILQHEVAIQRALLADEGVEVSEGGRVDLAVYGWDAI
ncbi:MAG: MGMT family protein [Anaerolineae bacterium]